MSTHPRSSPTSPLIVDLATTDTDDNGKRKRHGGLLESIQRWLALRGKLVVVIAAALILSVFLVPPLKLILQGSNHHEGRSSSSTTQQQQTKQKQSAASLSETTIIPPCNKSPWKPNENLVGKCPGDLKPYKAAKSVSECASTCCQNDNCITWQYRSDVGCLHGKDVRLGMEKDGVAAWCSDHPPQRWQGQYLIPHKSVVTNNGMTTEEIRASGCNEQTWNPNQQPGQCFGLGDVKKDASGSALECMRACCANDKCGAWQYADKLGCFYSKGMHGCQGDDGNPVKFEPFIGRRKFMDGRTYVDKKGKPWQQTLDE